MPGRRQRKKRTVRFQVTKTVSPMTEMLREADILVIDRVWVVSGQAGFEWKTRIPALRSYDEPSTDGQYQLLEAMLPEFAARAGAVRARFDLRLRPL